MLSLLRDLSEHFPEHNAIKLKDQSEQVLVIPDTLLDFLVYLILLAVWVAS